MSVYLPQAAGVPTVTKGRLLRHHSGFQFNTFCCLPQILYFLLLLREKPDWVLFPTIMQKLSGSSVVEGRTQLIFLL